MPSGNDNFTALLEAPAASAYEAGNLDEAIQLTTKALAETRHTVADEPESMPKLVDKLEALGELHRQAGNFEKAESMYREALETAPKSGAARRQMARLHSGLATLYDFNQREEQAIALYEKAIEDYESLEPPSSRQSAQLRNNLAMIYKSLGRNALAEQHYLMAMEALEKIHGRNDERVAAVFNNLGSLYYTAGFADQAKEMHTEALDIRIQVFGPEHPEVGQSYCNLASANYELEDNAAMQENYEKCLRIYEANLDVSAHSYEDVAADYIAVLESINEDKKAQIIRKRVEKVLLKK